MPSFSRPLTQVLRNLRQRDLSTWSLLIANAITIGFATIEGWDLGPLLWIYWCQSVIIGIFNFIRILTLNQFSTENFKVNERQPAPTRATLRSTAFFFLVHYGIFHVCYLLFLMSDLGRRPPQLWPAVLCVGTFFANHLLSFFHNFRRDRARVPNLGTVMFFPYARILPMHLTIIFGAFAAYQTGAVILFLALKTVADLIMHSIEHREEVDARVEVSPGTPGHA
jgi:hypothetical protein